MHDIGMRGELLGETDGEYGNELNGELFEFGNEFGNEIGLSAESEGPFNEVELMELSSELLEIGSEAELDQFLGKLIKGATKAVGSFVRSPVGKALGGALKKVAKTALPIAGKALGTMVGGPVGGMIGGKLAGAASNLFELELEGLSQEDREFEMAKQFVRLAGTAAQTAARTPAGNNPVRTAQTALTTAAKTYAPGLLRSNNGASAPTASRQSGRWVRRGRTIVVMGI